MAKGSLTVVGIGYQLAVQLTPETLESIQRANKFLFLADVVTERWLQQLHPNGETLGDTYAIGKERIDSYEEMIERMLAPVRDGQNVCAAFYGHPGVFAYPPHEAIRRARKEGLTARMLPGISSADCFFADVGVDPSVGCQLFEATDFLIRKRKLDTSIGLLLWQVGSIGISTYHSDGHEAWNLEGVRILAEVLAKTYSSRHKVIVYEASVYPVCDPSIEKVSLARLPAAKISSASMLYVPPKSEARLDHRMLAKLHMS